MARAVEARKESVSGGRQDAFADTKSMVRSNSELRLTQHSRFHWQTLSWPDLPEHQPPTTSSFTNPAPNQTKGESKDDKLNSTVASERTKFGRRLGGVRNWRDRKNPSGSTTGQKQSANPEESRNAGAKISIWKKLLGKLKGQAQKIRPARSVTTTPQDSQPSHPWPRHESFRMPRPRKPLNLIKAMSLHSKLPSQMYLQEDAPLWHRRNVPRPPPLDSRIIRFNRRKRTQP